MSVEQTRKTLNQLDKELSDLEKKLADETKKEADKTKKINDVQKSITKNTTTAMLQAKMRQIQNYQNDLVKVTSEKANINKKIADKRKKRADTAVKLQKEEATENKRLQKAQETTYNNYEKRISDLTLQLQQGIAEASKKESNLYQSRSEEYDVFISHASEDKESFADELCKELQCTGIKVWYDAISMTWGDSLRAKIDSGLSKSKYGIVVLSKDYIKKGWTQYELDGLFQREMTDGKTILPIWHNITKKEVQDFSPTLAGRIALNTAVMTPVEIATELKKILCLNEELAEDKPHD
ncbi:MAG: TIR domain-containing protein [Clostridia bacterium]|nr:TIR domain-containing protein [Clostridia bacterium]